MYRPYNKTIISQVSGRGKAGFGNAPREKADLKGGQGIWSHREAWIRAFEDDDYLIFAVCFEALGNESNSGDCERSEATPRPRESFFPGGLPRRLRLLATFAVIRLTGSIYRRPMAPAGPYNLWGKHFRWWDGGTSPAPQLCANLRARSLSITYTHTSWAPCSVYRWLLHRFRIRNRTSFWIFRS